MEFKTSITIYFGGEEIAGKIITSEEEEINKREMDSCEGTSSGNKIAIKFKEPPPVTGASSRWRNSPG